MHALNRGYYVTSILAAIFFYFVTMWLLGNIWFFYAGLIHVRTRPAWQGRRLDLLALAGFAAVLFTYLGLGLLLKTNHPLL